MIDSETQENDILYFDSYENVTNDYDKDDNSFNNNSDNNNMVSLSRQINILKHRKKQAANDAQLLMNRIALLQKEEERGRKKIVLVKTKAEEIIALREENEKRVKAYINATDEEVELIKKLKNRHQNFDNEHEKSKQQQLNKLKSIRKEGAIELKQEKKSLARLMIQDQQYNLHQKQLKHENIKRMEEAAKQKREADRKEHERKIKEEYERRAKAELMEAARAEKLVKELERKEREWIEKLQQTKNLQEQVAQTLENVLTVDYIKDDYELPQIETPYSSNRSYGKLPIKGIMTPRLQKKQKTPFHIVHTPTKSKTKS
eukprot:gene18384-24083_t